MASTAAFATTQPALSEESKDRKPKPRPRRPNYNYIHRNALPVEVHPLPTLIPHNPLSLVAIALAYLAQVLAPPVRPTYNGYFSSSSSSIHVTDPDTIRKLWEMGFFGRGSLSRSEPTWLETQRKRGATAEENTGQRREERRKQKLERARQEQEVIEQELARMAHINGQTNGDNVKNNSADISNIATVLEVENSSRDTTLEPAEEKIDDTTHSYDEWKKAIEANGVPTPPPTSSSSEASQAENRPTVRLKRQKTVRFSPTIEAREFNLSAPVISPIKSPGTSTPPESEAEKPSQLENQEHLNLSLEEAFFLSYGLGVLQIFCDDSETVLPPISLLSLFRRHSYFPPRSLSVASEPDDPFMVSYAVYHHYRSLGWCVRSGVKFSVDYLLYNRGPAFSHAEFAVVILPSYTHQYWGESAERRNTVEQRTKKTWWWLHGINRVQAQVKKQLVLCYVDVPPPLTEEEREKNVDIGHLLSRYKIRDVNVRRWTPNRSRN